MEPITIALVTGGVLGIANLGYWDARSYSKTYRAADKAEKSYSKIIKVSENALSRLSIKDINPAIVNDTTADIVKLNKHNEKLLKKLNTIKNRKDSWVLSSMDRVYDAIHAARGDASSGKTSMIHGKREEWIKDAQKKIDEVNKAWTHLNKN